MIRSFRNTATEDIFNGINSKVARNLLPQNLWKIAFRKLDQLDSVETLLDLRIPPGNQFEALKGNRKGQYSIRINRQYRICFSWTETGPIDVEITDYH
ncbi:type II toxin-antitoxin system RelE/ParE family toxin [bacterium]|nr:type II toxin-antitoxin system RelE/ParE family toxin [bacterium]